MRFPSKEIVEQVRRQYPVGTRVELLHMSRKWQTCMRWLIYMSIVKKRTIRN